MVQGRFHLSSRKGCSIQRECSHCGDTRGKLRTLSCRRTIRRASCQEPSGTTMVAGRRSGCAGGRKRFSSPSGGKRSATGCGNSPEKSRSSSPGSKIVAFSTQCSAKNPVPLARFFSLGCRNRTTWMVGQETLCKCAQMQLAGGKLQIVQRSVRNPRGLCGPYGER